MDVSQKQAENALQAAQMYYYQNLPMKKIATELNVSASTVSRLITWARSNGLVEIRINDLHGRASSLEEIIRLRFKLGSVTVVPVPEIAGRDAWQERVARVAANYLNQVMKSNMVLGVAWGRMINHIAKHLTPKLLINSQVVQLNGGDVIQDVAIASAAELIARFANNYEGVAHPFHVPTFFDEATTKEAVWRERSVKRILALHERVDIVLYSVGAFEEGDISALYLSDYLQPEDFAQMRAYDVVGDIANVLIRPNGTYKDIPLNQRACGPDLDLLRQADRAICVVSGHNKLPGLQAAIAGGYVTDLILDEPTARRLVD